MNVGAHRARTFVKNTGIVKPKEEANFRHNTVTKRSKEASYTHITATATDIVQPNITEAKQQITNRE
jgi:hypothetical protein